MEERLYDWIVGHFIGGDRISGWAAKAGAARGVIVALIAVLSALDHALGVFQAGHTWHAAQEVGVIFAAGGAWAALTQAVLGLRRAQDNAIRATIAAGTATHQALPSTTVGPDVSKALIEDSVRAAGVPIPPELVSTPVPR